jgi:drug/metabolite transporter (DMT)-like permease
MISRFDRFVPYVAVSLAVLFWGLSFVATKIALESLTLFMLLSIRFIFAASVFLMLMTWRGFPRFTKTEHLQIFLAALFQPGLYFLCETTGLQYTSASKASLIIATIPILVLALSIVFLKERLTLVIVSGMILSIVGVALLIIGDTQFQWAFEGSMIGDLLILGAVLSMAIYTVTLKNVTKHRSPLDITGMLMCYGALFFTPPFLRELPQIQWSAVYGRSWVALACLAVFATIGAFLSFNYALSKLSASRTAIFLNCVPVVTALGAWIILGERLSLMQFLGGGLVLGAVYLTNFAGKDNHTRAQSQAVMSSQLADSEV